MDQFATQVVEVQAPRLRVLLAYLAPHVVASEAIVAQVIVDSSTNRGVLLARGLTGLIDYYPASSVEPGVAVLEKLGDYYADADKGASCEKEWKSADCDPSEELLSSGRSIHDGDWHKHDVEKIASSDPPTIHELDSPLAAPP